MRRLALCTGSERFGQGRDVLSGPRMAIWTDEAGIDDRTSTEANDRFMLHIQEIDPQTLSPESP